MPIPTELREILQKFLGLDEFEVEEINSIKSSKNNIAEIKTFLQKFCADEYNAEFRDKLTELGFTRPEIVRLFSGTIDPEIFRKISEINFENLTKIFAPKDIVQMIKKSIEQTKKFSESLNDKKFSEKVNKLNTALDEKKLQDQKRKTQITIPNLFDHSFFRSNYEIIIDFLLVNIEKLEKINKDSGSLINLLKRS